MALRLALQLYSVGEDAKKDLDGTLRRVKEMGYEGVEFAGLYGHDAAEVAEMLHQYGLIPVSAHVPLEELETKFDEVAASYKQIGCPYLAVPYLIHALQPVSGNFEEAISRIEAVAKRYTEAGFIVSYHNHDFEFKTINGVLALDLLYDRISEEYLKTQIDTCWANVGGVDPASYVLKYTGRAPTVHIKDFYLKGKPQNHMYKLLCDKDDRKEEEGNHAAESPRTVDEILREKGGLENEADDDDGRSVREMVKKGVQNPRHDVVEGIRDVNAEESRVAEIEQRDANAD